jgi:DHA2 family multidrug resistance protein
LLLAIGLGLTAWSFNSMTGWTPDVSKIEVVRVTIIQGIGLGFFFVPLTAAALSTLPLEDRTNGAGVFNLARNMGSSIGISVVNALLTRNTQVNHADIALHVTAVNRAFEDPAIHHFWDPSAAAGRAALDALITRQAQIIAYIDDYKLLLVAMLVALPLLALFKGSASGGGGAPVVVD